MRTLDLMKTTLPILTLAAVCLAPLSLIAPAKAAVPTAIQVTAPRPLRNTALTLKDVVVARYAEEPAAAGLFRFFRKMTVVDKSLNDKDLYILWLSRDEPLPKVGARCDIRYHMGFVNSAAKATTTTMATPAALPPAAAPTDSRIMDDFSCKA